MFNFSPHIIFFQGIMNLIGFLFFVVFFSYENDVVTSCSNHTIHVERLQIRTHFANLLIFKRKIFVDKSLLIKEFLEDEHKMVCITRPRQWGKSTNAEMIECAFDIETYKNGTPKPIEERFLPVLFKGGNFMLQGQEITEMKLEPLKISSNNKAMSQLWKHPVISLSLTGVKGDYESVTLQIANAIGGIIDGIPYNKVLKSHCTSIIANSGLTAADCVKILENHREAFKSRDILEKSLYLLSGLLFCHFQTTTVLIIDGYDAPVNYACRENVDCQKIRGFIQTLLSSTFKLGSNFLFKGLITGVVPYAKAEFEFGLDSTQVDVLDREYCSHYGFTEDEVKSLLQKYSTTKFSFDDVRSWYDGYYANTSLKIYNPYSIVTCFGNENRLSGFWIKLGSSTQCDDEFLGRLLMIDENQRYVQELYTSDDVKAPLDQYTAVQFDLTAKQENFYLILIHLGYLTAVPLNYCVNEKRVYNIKIPNREVRNYFMEMINHWTMERLNATGICEQAENYIMDPHENYNHSDLVDAVANVLKYDHRYTKISPTLYCNLVFGLVIRVFVNTRWILKNEMHPYNPDSNYDCIITIVGKNESDPVIAIPVKYHDTDKRLKFGLIKMKARLKLLEIVDQLISCHEDQLKKTTGNLIVMYVVRSMTEIFITEKEVYKARRADYTWKWKKTTRAAKIMYRHDLKVNLKSELKGWVKKLLPWKN